MHERFSNSSRSRELDRGDRLLCLIVTAIYTVLTLINLGTLRFPKTAWTAPDDGVITFVLENEQDVTGIWFNGNIATGRLLFSAEDGQFYEYSQVYGEMFSWKKKSVSFHTRTITAYRTSGDIALNEIAFLGADGQILTVSVTGPSGTEGALLDEQSTVPREATYYNGMYFDEIYHARTAYEFIHGMSVYEWTHPPLGKELIALGVLIFGMTPFGWRVVPALFGAAMLPLFFILGKRLFRRRDYAFLASALFALDTMHFAQTRIATVDVFIVFFILLMYLFMLDYLEKDYLKEPLKKLWIPLGCCGISFGLGVAAKWTGLYAGLGLAVLFFAHLIRQGLETRRDRKNARLYRRRTMLTLLYCLLFFVLLPALIYYLSYVPFYRYEASRHAGPYGFRDSLTTLFSQQKSMFSYHSGLDATHLCQSAWYEWPFAERSVWFYFSNRGSGAVSNISSFGNPAVWWISAVGVILLAVDAVFGRLRKLPGEDKRSLWLLGIAVAANLLPWTLVPRCTFQYHYFPTLPFVILSAVFLLKLLEESGTLKPGIKWIWLGAAGIYFVLLLPAASGIPMPRIYAQFLEHVLPTGVLFHGAV